MLKLSSQTLAPIKAVESLGAYIIFCSQIAATIKKIPKIRTLLFTQLEFIGNKSLSIIILSSIMIGAVFGIQFGTIFKIFGAETMIGAAASFALSKELSPVIGAFLVTGRSGSSMAAEIATMKVKEQLDAMRVMAVNPVEYLALPRVIASIIMMPLLTGIFTLCGVLSCYLIGVLIFNVDVGIFIENIKWISQPKHITQGLVKAAIFGAIFSTIGCYKGFHAHGGAKGVGQSTTASVVLSLVSILISDFFISYWQLE